MTNAVQEFYKNKNVFITGGTGFVGKILIEKLIRSCDVQGIYLLVREKKGVSSQKRLDTIFENDVFLTIKKTHPDFLQKIHLMEGDISKKCLGLSEANLATLANKINIVIHCAASLNMEGNLKHSIHTNCLGTLELLQLLEHSKQLEALVSVSTAYSACLEDVIEEKFYDPPVNYKFAIEMSEKLDEKTFQNITKGLLSDYPNSYVYTKLLAENIIKENCNGRPLGVFRPTIIIASLKEPIKGWTDNVYGALGVTIATGSGMLRVLQGSSDVLGDLVPVDTCANALLCSAWHINKIWKEKKNKYKPMIYNYSSYKSNLNMTYGEYSRKYCSLTSSHHSKYSLWVPFLIFTTNPVIYKILAFLLHTIPMYIVDGILWLTGNKPILNKIYTKMYKIMDVLNFFYARSWEIKNDNIMSLWKILSSQDQKTFYFNLTELTEEDVLAHFTDTCEGLKKYIIKDDFSEEGERRNKKRYKRLVIAHYTLKYSLVALLAYAVWKIVSVLF